MNFPPVPSAYLSKPGYENLSVIVLLENRFFPIATSYDVIAGTRILKSNRSSHPPF
jgi:hypothetical protein